MRLIAALLAVLLLVPAAHAAPGGALAIRTQGHHLCTPYDLGPLLSAWWDADDHGTTNMTDDGSGLISSWTARVGGGTATVATATTTARPTWTSTAWSPNGKPGLTFDGVANNLTSSVLTALPTGSVGGEIWTLVDQEASSTNLRILGYGSNSANSSRVILTNNTGSTIRLGVSNTTTGLTDTATIFVGPSIASGNWAGTTMGGRINGGVTTPASVALSALNTATTSLKMFAGFAGSQIGKGTVRHMIVTKTLTVSQRQMLEGFLAWDGWSSAAANPLPVTHPYKYGPPKC